MPGSADAALFCGIDVGTQGSKVGIYDAAGVCHATGYAEHVFDNIRPGWIELDPFQIVEAVISAARQATVQIGQRANDVAAISLSGILCGPVFVDQHWVPVRPLIPFLDTRAQDELAWLRREVEPLWETESANATLDTYVMAVTYEWLRRHEPDNFARIRAILSLAPFVAGRLAGLTADDAFTDPSHLSGWIIGWTAATGQVSERQADLLGIDVARCPRVVQPTDVIGALTAEVASRIGFRPGTPICAGAGDVMQSNLSSGLTRPGRATDVAGTASILTVGVTGPLPAITAIPGMLYSLATLPGQSLYWGYVKAGGLSLRWFRDQVLDRGGDDSVYPAYDSIAAQVAPGSGGVLFSPYLSGGNPDNPHASGTWLGMTMATDGAVMWRSMLEAIGFEYADFLSAFAANGVAVSSVQAVGGGARSALWNSIKADVVGMPWRVPDRQDGAILANAALAGTGIGLLDDLASTVESWVGQGTEYAPDPERVRRYQHLRQVRSSLLSGSLRDVFAAVAQLGDDEPQQSDHNGPDQHSVPSDHADEEPAE